MSYLITGPAHAFKLASLPPAVSFDATQRAQADREAHAVTMFQITDALKHAVPKHMSLAGGEHYTSWRSYVAAFAERGGVIEACAAAVIGSPVVNMFVEPSGAVRVISTHEQIFCPPYRVVGSSFPHSSVPAAALADAALAVGQACWRAREFPGCCGCLPAGTVWVHVDAAVAGGQAGDSHERSHAVDGCLPKDTSLLHWRLWRLYWLCGIGRLARLLAGTRVILPLPFECCTCQRASGLLHGCCSSCGIGYWTSKVRLCASGFHAWVPAASLPAGLLSIPLLSSSGCCSGCSIGHWAGQPLCI